ncbi:unnamed protein product [Cuscuta campestris]|uniref:Uncharacterized protein n=1 Tax=Cuscuta campestris TaxID=132261 RepID=A0A484MCU9_9ASTE|nr:unnamed protein product [Cuscuta campestris]
MSNWVIVWSIGMPKRIWRSLEQEFTSGTSLLMRNTLTKAGKLGLILLEDLASLAASGSANWLGVSSLQRTFVLDILEFILSNYVVLFRTLIPYEEVLRHQICSILMTSLRTDSEFEGETGEPYFQFAGSMTVGCPTGADVKTPVFGPSEGMTGMAEAIFGLSEVTIVAVAAVGPITEVTGADPIVALDPTKVVIGVDPMTALDPKGMLIRMNEARSLLTEPAKTQYRGRTAESPELSLRSPDPPSLIVVRPRGFRSCIPISGEGTKVFLSMLVLVRAISLDLPLWHRILEILRGISIMKSIRMTTRRFHVVPLSSKCGTS